MMTYAQDIKCNTGPETSYGPKFFLRSPKLECMDHWHLAGRAPPPPPPAVYEDFKQLTTRRQQARP